MKKVSQVSLVLFIGAVTALAQAPATSSPAPKPSAPLMHPEGCNIDNAFEQCFQAAGTAGLPYLMLHGLKADNVTDVYVNGVHWDPKNWSTFDQTAEWTEEDYKKMPRAMTARKVTYVLILRKMKPTTSSIWVDVHYPGYYYFHWLISQPRVDGTVPADH